MDTLATIARQRAVMTAVADVIVAAAAGKKLRVAVGYSDPNELDFADQLTRALYARGRPCRCLASRLNSGAAGGPLAQPAHSPMVAVITSYAPGPDESDLCRINIQLSTPDGVTPSVSSTPPGSETQTTRPVVDDPEPDIVIDYLDPDGPTVRHIVPTLARRPEPR